MKTTSVPTSVTHAPSVLLYLAIFCVFVPGAGKGAIAYCTGGCGRQVLEEFPIAKRPSSVTGIFNGVGRPGTVSEDRAGSGHVKGVLWMGGMEGGCDQGPWCTSVSTSAKLGN